MSDKQTPLTAKEIAIKQAAISKPSYYSEPFTPHEWVLDSMEVYSDQQTAALLDKLAAYESGGHTLIETTELNAHRESLDAAYQKGFHDNQEQVKGLIEQRNEAVGILQEVYQKIMARRSENRAPTRNKVSDFLSRLHSEEMKPVSPWISVNDRMPEVGENIYIHLDGETFPGAYDYDGDDILKFWDANDNPLDFVTTWAPRYVPAPPESLTDKK